MAKVYQTTKTPDGDFRVVELGGFAPPSKE